MPNLKGWEWLIIVALILILFGAKRLPDAARGLGRSLRIFKAETKGLAGDASTDASTDATPAPPVSAAPATPAPASIDPAPAPAAEAPAAPPAAPPAEPAQPERAEG
jgi:sec-independent protein translocase protein TatA